MSAFSTKIKREIMGLIPEAWRVGKLSEIAQIIMGQSPPGNTYNSDGMGIPMLNGPTEFTDYHPIPIQYTTKPTKLCAPEDILFCVRGSSTGRMNIADREYCIGRGLAAIRQNETSNTKYIQYVLLDIVRHIFAEAKGAGSTFPNISKEGLANRTVKIPPLPEQQEIAEILSAVDDAIETTDRIIKETQQLKKGLMQKLFTEGIGHKKFKKTKFLTVPEDWGVIKLRNIADFKNGTNFTKDEKGNVGGILMADVLNMYGEGVGINTKNFYRVNKRFNADYLLKKGDILFVRSSLKKEGVGWPALFEGYGEPASFCGFLIRARIHDERILPKFIGYFLRAPKTRGRIIGLSGTVAITNIGQDSLGILEIPVPSIKEQEKIIRIFEELDEKIKNEQITIKKLEQLKKGLMQVLLTGKVRVMV